MNLLKIFGILVGIFLIYYITSLVMVFLGVKIQPYNIYFLYILALIIFWAIIPNQEKIYV